MTVYEQKLTKSLMVSTKQASVVIKEAWINLTFQRLLSRGNKAREEVLCDSGKLQVGARGSLARVAFEKLFKTFPLWLPMRFLELSSSR